MRLAAGPLGPKKRYGMRSVLPPPCTVIAPEYTPAAGVEPESVAVITVEAPAPRIALGGVIFTEAAPVDPVDVNVRFAPLVPEFLIVIWRAMDKVVLAFTEPNEIVAGSAVSVAATAASAASSPPPIQRVSTVSPESSCVTVAEAVFTTADFTCAAVNPGCFCLTSAAAPDTIGVAKLVPSAMAYPSALYISPRGSYFCVAI